MEQDQKRILTLVAQAIFDKKGNNVIALDVRDLSTLADYVIIAEGNVDRHVRAIANEVEQVLKDEGIAVTHVEGRSSGDWMVLDYGDFVVHLFMPEMREKYRLEQLWSEGEIVDLDIDMVSHE